MNESDVIRILARIKAAWSKQPSDKEVIAVWHETLAGVPYDIAAVAVVEIIQSDREDPPTPGQVYEHSMRVFGRRPRPPLPAPEVPASPEEVRRLLDDFFARHPGPAAAERARRHGEKA